MALLDRVSGDVIRCSEQTALRHERDRPGELVHMDVKKLGRIPAGGWRLHGRAAGSTSRDRATEVGFDDEHSPVDGHSRLTYSEVLTDERGISCGVPDPCCGLLRRPRHPTIERLITGNAWAYRQSLEAVSAQPGIT